MSTIMSIKAAARNLKACLDQGYSEQKINYRFHKIMLACQQMNPKASYITRVRQELSMAMQKLLRANKSTTGSLRMDLVSQADYHIDNAARWLRFRFTPFDL